MAEPTFRPSVETVSTVPGSGDSSRNEVYDDDVGDVMFGNAGGLAQSNEPDVIWIVGERAVKFSGVDEVDVFDVAFIRM